MPSHPRMGVSFVPTRIVRTDDTVGLEARKLPQSRCIRRGTSLAAVLAGEIWMPARPLGSGTIALGLVSIPVRLYPAAVSRRVSFHMLHAKCGSRVRTQWFCPVCHRVVGRDELVRGYEVSKGRFVRMAEAE